MQKKANILFVTTNNKNVELQNAKCSFLCVLNVGAQVAWLGKCRIYRWIISRISESPK